MVDKSSESDSKRKTLDLGLLKGLVTTMSALASLFLVLIDSMFAFVATGRHWLLPQYLIVICGFVFFGVIFYFTMLYFYTRSDPSLDREALEKGEKLGHHFSKIGICQNCGVSVDAAVGFSWKCKANQQPTNAVDTDSAELHYDLFLSHNSDDKSAIRAINEILVSNGVLTWLDEIQLKPGLPWQPELERQIASISAAAVFVGNSGFGPWHDMEMQAFLSEFLKRGCPVVPVLLPNAPDKPALPLFLRQMTWIDLRRNFELGIQRLIKAIPKNPGLPDKRTKRSAGSGPR